ncbi:hypothetical protein ABES03_08600 [Neobacillus rhizosphaerae]|uniref:hypothetical protein n=1 Tax=Neobacillus rhizosphaerae TaxID=2880965 RepID=UPI003D29D6A4
MLEAFVEEEKRQDDMQNQRVSWFTSHLMNASGNYKKRIQPTDLYKPMDYREEQGNSNIVKRFESPSQKEEYLKQLMMKFGK